MIDKHRHRNVHAPHGFLPNWVLAILVAGAMALVLFANTLI